MENNKTVPVVADNVDKEQDSAVDLDQALAIAGVGCYNLKYCLALSLFLIAAIVEPVGYAFVLPAAVCDLNMSASLRGFISSVPYIGIVLTSYPWGYLVDTRGRKLVMIYASLAAGGLSVLSAFMPDVISFTICKLLSSLCIACPAAAPFTFIGEIIPQKYRDITLTITTALQIIGAVLVPLLAWGVLPLNFSADFGAYYFRPWRLLVIVNASFFFIASASLMFGPESPKFLISQRKHDEALKVLQAIYAGNKNKSPGEYPVKQLKMDIYERPQVDFLTSLKVQTLPLLKPPLLKWLALNGFLLFGMFSVLNGLYMWVPDIVNRVLSGDGTGLTACDVIAEGMNETSAEGECNDTIDENTFLINAVVNLSCAAIALAIGFTIKMIGKKNLLLVIHVLMGIFCILINVIRQEILFAVLLSSFRVLGVTIGPINAFTIEIFPTHLRGMAVSLTMMMGRAGSVFGANVAGLMLNSVCQTTFYFFGGLLIVCGALSQLLPKVQD